MQPALFSRNKSGQGIICPGHQNGYHKMNTGGDVQCEMFTTQTAWQEELPEVLWTPDTQLGF